MDGVQWMFGLYNFKIPIRWRTIERQVFRGYIFLDIPLHPKCVTCTKNRERGEALTSASYRHRCLFWPVQATILTLSAISSATSSSGVSKHTDSSVISGPVHTPEPSPSSGAMTNMSDSDSRPCRSHPPILTGPIGWLSEPRPEGFSRHLSDSTCFIWNGNGTIVINTEFKMDANYGLCGSFCIV